MSMVGFTKVCAAHSGGVGSIYFAKASDVTSMTLETSEDWYDTITMASTMVFKKYEFVEDTADLTIESIRENGAQKHVSKIEFKMDKLAIATRTALQELFDESDCGMIGIVVDSNGNKVVLGYSELHLKSRPLRAESGSALMGKAMTDENGATIILAAESARYPHFFVGTVPVT